MPVPFPYNIRFAVKTAAPVPPLSTGNVPLIIALASNVVAPPPVNIAPFLRKFPVILTSPITSKGYAGVVIVPIPTFPVLVICNFVS